jgi:glucose-1-phosphate adenylyltransferase
VEECTLKDTLVSEGCVLRGADVAHSILGIRTWIGPRTLVRDSLLLGADFYETPDMVEEATRSGTPPMGIGAGSVIQRAIVDKNARIGVGASRTPTAPGGSSATGSWSFPRTASSRTGRRFSVACRP